MCGHADHATHPQPCGHLHYTAAFAQPSSHHSRCALRIAHLRCALCTAHCTLHTHTAHSCAPHAGVYFGVVHVDAVRVDESVLAEAAQQAESCGESPPKHA
jgi:hypothetical protein